MMIGKAAREPRNPGIVLGVLMLAGCGGLSATVDRALLKEITIENKLLLFDAENDVSIAIDEREQLQRQVHDIREDIRDAEAQITEAESDEERASQKKDAKRAQLSDMAGQVFKLKIDYLEDYLDYLRDKVRAQEGLILVAEAKFELAKAKLVKKNNVRGASDIELADYEEQVGKYVQRAKDNRTDLAQVEKAVEATKKRWLDTRDKLMAQSGGGLGSPWAEESALWGETW